MQKTQKGGTLIGFVAGVLVGLGAALAVAVYVTKVPVPFVDRGAIRNPSQDAIEAERNRNWNPNSAITGGPANTPAPAPATGADAPAIVAPGIPAPPGSAPPQASGDPLGDLVREREQRPSSAVANVTLPPNDPFIYFVQVGAYRTPADAEAQRARLAMLGLDARVTEREQSGQTVFRVRVGPFELKADADATQAQLVSAGQEAALVRVQR